MPFQEVDGIKIHYRESGSPTRGLQTTLFVHGAGGSWRNWQEQLSGIEGHLFALDLPGHGQSEGKAQNSVAAYRELVRRFSQRLGLRRFVLAGHSMGGAITLDFALAHPEALSGIVLVGSGARLRVKSETLETLAKGQHALDIVRYMYGSSVAAEVLEQAAVEMKQVPPEVYLSDFQACDRFSILDEIASIQVPTLILCGQEDLMTPVKYSEYLKKAIPHSTLALVPDAGHMAMLERPQVVNREIQGFLSALYL